MNKLFYLLIPVLFLIASCSANDIRFDSNTWKNWRETEATMSLRWDMRRDLIRKHKLVGMTVDEIINLLGEPNDKTKTEYWYSLGMARSGIDTGHLILEIENEKVIDFRVFRG